MESQPLNCDLESLPDHVYDTLPHDKDVFRVVRIRPSRTEGVSGIEHLNQPIECEMKTAPLENSHSCLSYCWGSDAHLNSTIVNGHRLRIRDNLYRFLTDARKRGLEDWLFIDALSINQKSTEERNHQVQRMSLIYRNAWKVYVWLDPTPTAISERLRQTFATSILRAKDGIQKAGPVQSAEILHLANESSLIDVVTYNADEELFIQLITNEYFDRAWVTSEVWLARQTRFVFAGHSWEREAMLDIILRYESDSHHWSSSGTAGRRRDGIADLLLPSDPKRRLSTLEQTLRGLRNLSCECEDDRDRIYSLLAIARDMSGFKVDYSESVSDLFHRVLDFVSDQEGAQHTMHIDPIVLATHMRADPPITSQHVWQYPGLREFFPARVAVFKESLQLRSWQKAFDMANINFSSQELELARVSFRHLSGPALHDVSWFAATRDGLSSLLHA